MSHRLTRATRSTGLNVEVRHRSWVAVVCVEGEVDSGSVSRLRAAIDEAAVSGHDVLIDLSACPFVDSSALGQVLRGRQLALSRDVAFAVVCVVGTVPARVLDIVGAGAIPLYRSRADALHTMRRAHPEVSGAAVAGGAAA
jgi:anti-sigma B factor antagonist